MSTPEVLPPVDGLAQVPVDKPAPPPMSVAPYKPPLPAPNANASLYVGELDPTVTEAILFEIFNMIGPVARYVRCLRSPTRALTAALFCYPPVMSHTAFVSAVMRSPVARSDTPMSIISTVTMVSPPQYSTGMSKSISVSQARGPWSNSTILLSKATHGTIGSVLVLAAQLLMLSSPLQPHHVVAARSSSPQNGSG